MIKKAFFAMLLWLSICSASKAGIAAVPCNGIKVSVSENHLPREYNNLFLHGVVYATSAELSQTSFYIRDIATDSNSHIALLLEVEYQPVTNQPRRANEFYLATYDRDQAGVIDAALLGTHDEADLHGITYYYANPSNQNISNRSNEYAFVDTINDCQYAMLVTRHGQVKSKKGCMATVADVTTNHTYSIATDGLIIHNPDDVTIIAKNPDLQAFATKYTSHALQLINLISVPRSKQDKKWQESFKSLCKDFSKRTNYFMALKSSGASAEAAELWRSRMIIK